MITTVNYSSFLLQTLVFSDFHIVQTNFNFYFLPPFFTYVGIICATLWFNDTVKTPSVCSDMGSPILSHHSVVPLLHLLFRALSSGLNPCLLLAVVPHVFCQPHVGLFFTSLLPSFLINLSLHTSRLLMFQWIKPVLGLVRAGWNTYFPIRLWYVSQFFALKTFIVTLICRNIHGMGSVTT